MGMIRADQIEDGVVAVTFRTEDDAPFVIGEGVVEQLEELLQELVANKDLRGVLFRSEVPGVFCAGADVDAMAALESPAEAEVMIRRGQDLFERIAHLPQVTVALVDGVCVGGGLELALACDARLATEDPKTQLGLPETKLGILPAWGGSTRLPRLIGLGAAIPLVTAGKTVNARKARRLGLVDDVVASQQLVPVALDLIEERGRGGHGRRPRKGMIQRFLDHTPPGRALTQRFARKAILKQTKGRFPAPMAALEVMASSVTAPTSDSLESERQEVLKLLQTSAHENLLRLFRLTRDGNRPPVYGAGRDTEGPRELAVIGGGTMGAGIAALAVGKGLGVRLIDPQPDALAAGLRRVENELKRRVRRGDMSKAEAHLHRTRFTVSTKIDGLRSMDCVIEAAPERMELKHDILTQVVAETSDRTMIATNTSSLSVDELADATGVPGRFLGLHFFNPPGLMPLLEIVRGAKTSDHTLARGLAAAKALGKTPIVVGDGPGFLVNRLLAPYFLEACRICDGGVDREFVDASIRAFGLPMGPFRLMDEVGLDVIVDAGRHAATRDGNPFELHPSIEQRVEKGHLGKKSGRGFYTYGKRRPSRRNAAADPDLSARLVGRMVTEAQAILAEGLVLCPEDVDIGTVFGIGFPPEKGGLLHWAEESS